MQKKILLLLSLFFIPTAPSSAAMDRCDLTTLDEISCYKEAADRAQTQYLKDTNYLIQLAQYRNPESTRFFRISDVAYSQFLNKNCESDGHDALGGSLEEVIVEKCRKDQYLSRLRVFEKIGQSHPLGLEAEKKLGRPICQFYAGIDEFEEIPTLQQKKDLAELRDWLDKKARSVVSPNTLLPEELTPSLVSRSAEQFRSLDAVNLCLGIMTAFCPMLSENRDNIFMIKASRWLEKCQKSLITPYYRHSSERLRQLKLLESQN